MKNYEKQCTKYLATPQTRLQALTSDLYQLSEELREEPLLTTENEFDELFSYHVDTDDIFENEVTVEDDVENTNA